MRPHPLLAGLMFIAAGLLTSTPSGASVPDPSGIVDQVACGQHAIDCHRLDIETCDMHTKMCPEAGETHLPATAMNGQLLQPLRPYINEQLYQILFQLLGGNKEGDPDPVPPLPLPEDLPVDVRHDRFLGFHGAGGYLYAGFNITQAGVHASGQSNTSANASLGNGNPPPAADGQVPCRDSRGCPDLIVERSELLEGGIYDKEFDSTDCAVQENVTAAGMRRLLRFTFTSPNIGRGDLVIGNPDDSPDWFQWGTCHAHWHFKEYADYRLWTVESYLQWRSARNADPDATPAEVLQDHPALLEGLVAGHKQGFCAIDIVMVLPFKLSPTYRDCAHNQGITAGWADVYDFRLDGQWIDITDVEPGLYVLEAEVNPERLFQEEDYTRNSGAVFMLIPPA